MSRIVVTSLAAALLPLGLAWGAVAGGDLPAGSYASGPSCDIRVVRSGGGLVLEGVVMSSVPVAGSYDLRISQSGYGGQSNIRQGGEFEAVPGSDSSLGVVSLPATSAPGKGSLPAKASHLSIASIRTSRAGVFWRHAMDSGSAMCHWPPAPRVTV